MKNGIRWMTWVALSGLLLMLGWNVWTAVMTYQSITAKEIVTEQQKEQVQRQQFERQMQAAGAAGELAERPRKHGFFGDSTFQTVKRAMKDAGSDSGLMVWIAFGFWLAVEGVKRFTKLAGDSVKQYARHVVMYLREHHRAIGWLAFGFTAVHSIYYLALWLLKSMNFEMILLWSGIVAFAAFLLLALWGEWLQWHGRDKGARKVHWFMSLLMIGGMLVHDFGTLGKLLIIIAAFVGFYLIGHWIERISKPKVPATNE